MHIVFGSDHAGYKMKQVLKDHLKSKYQKPYELFIIDIGCNTDEQKSDYPDFAKSLCEEVLKLNCIGVLICGTGIGISIAANRHPSIRAALVHDALGARLSRLHNNANVICFGERMIGEEVAKDCLAAFLQTNFEGGRHSLRVDKLNQFDYNHKI